MTTTTDFARWRQRRGHPTALRRSRGPLGGEPPPGRDADASSGPAPAAGVGLEHMEAGALAEFVADDGRRLVGTIVQWGPRGATVHVKRVAGDALHKVPYDAILRVTPPRRGLAKSASESVFTVNDMQPGDRVTVRSAVGLFWAAVVEATPTEVTALLDDGRVLLVPYDGVAAVESGAGLAELHRYEERERVWREEQLERWRTVREAAARGGGIPEAPAVRPAAEPLEDAGKEAGLVVDLDVAVNPEGPLGRPPRWLGRLASALARPWSRAKELPEEV